MDDEEIDVDSLDYRFPPGTYARAVYDVRMAADDLARELARAFGLYWLAEQLARLLSRRK